MSNVGQRFKDIRQTLNFSQEKFGNELGISSQGISNIEKNKSFLTLEKLQSLKKFDINLNFLIYGTGEMFNSNAVQFEQNQKEFAQKVRIILKQEGLI